VRLFLESHVVLCRDHLAPPRHSSCLKAVCPSDGTRKRVNYLRLLFITSNQGGLHFCELLMVIHVSIQSFVKHIFVFIITYLAYKLHFDNVPLNFLAATAAKLDLRGYKSQM